MKKEEAIADMRRGYRVQYVSVGGVIRWMDRDGQAWKRDHFEGSTPRQSELATLALDGYIRMPFTSEDARRWTSQGGWLTLRAPYATPLSPELDRRFRFDLFGEFVVMVEGTEYWVTTPFQDEPDTYVPVDPNSRFPASTRPTQVRNLTRFDIIFEDV
jgi:hypothetical protein